MLIHTLTDFLSIFIGMQLYFMLSKGSPVPDGKKLWYILAALVGALLGSRLLAALENPSLFIDPPTWLYYYANKTVIGGIAGGIIGVEIVKKILNIHSRTGDVVVIPLIVAIIVGRIGCQLAGVSDGTIGVPCDYAWCFRQGGEFDRHPLPLYEIVYLLALLPLFHHLARRRTFHDGFLFRLFIILYFGFRFFLEFLKDINVLAFGFSAIQLACLSFVIYYAFDSMKHSLYKRKQGETK